MMSVLELTIQERLSRFLRDEISLHEFEDWFLPVLWDLAESRDEAARQLAGRIENIISEFSSGDRSLASFREALEDTNRPFVPSYAENSCGESYPLATTESNAEPFTNSVAA